MSAKAMQWRVDVYTMRCTRYYCVCVRTMDLNAFRMYCEWIVTWVEVGSPLYVPLVERSGQRVKAPPPQHFPRQFRCAKFFDSAAHWLFTFKSRASFETIFAKIGHTVTTLHDFLYMLVGLKMAQKCKWSFLTLFIKSWLFSLSLAEIKLF